ncbi:MAG: pyrroline-5-carboxylate reductase dimerization domain-containing protein [Methanobrevibacter ruminantium]|uniref:pyrroline-5-carboxylate reductase family protein n=1 Tax=Methanobrevibacter ruminantium TaxID=83816 RepID=UPI0026F308CB|nr:pyrroline-5-carboxylate reductase dimerization domain-containing protein [Methanobrevibacter ruminantium]MCI5737678.1 NAD(P)-binding domain-containing protein [Methanobrevibacter ruminantium]MDD6049531.1 pyrroline-5-carboxylate reductase dimerization domain-containing protein [Methanobrevibacter ruminantium]MDO5843076.1 pyrroline-5-carboxylate reductase dimerization domain-containing protein [Methanobrevibacter ruminantium]
MKIGVIGYGNMGSMIVNNILKLNLLLDDEELIVSNRHLNKFESLIEEYPEENLSITSDNKEVATQCQKILISVKTPQFKEIIEEIKPFLNESTHIIYTCSGLNFNHIKQYFDGKLSLVIPTLASTVTSNNSISSLARRKGVTLVKHNSKVELQERLFVEDLFNEFSYVRRIDNPIYFNEEENNLDPSDNELEISTIISSCGPAFIAMMIKKFTQTCSESSNISQDEIEDMILKTVIGTAMLKDDQGLSNEDIINKVATKGGITQEGVDLLDKKFNKISKALIKTLLSRYDEVNDEMNKTYLKK